MCERRAQRGGAASHGAVAHAMCPGHVGQSPQPLRADHVQCVCAHGACGACVLHLLISSMLGYQPAEVHLSEIGVPTPTAGPQRGIRSAEVGEPRQWHAVATSGVVDAYPSGHESLEGAKCSPDPGACGVLR